MKLRASVLLFLGVAGATQAAVQTDIEYGTAAGVSLKLDAFVPEGPGPFPAVILVHGGGWTAGDKDGGKNKGYMMPMQEPLVAAGFAGSPSTIGSRRNIATRRRSRMSRPPSAGSRATPPNIVWTRAVSRSPASLRAVT